MRLYWLLVVLCASALCDAGCTSSCSCCDGQRRVEVHGRCDHYGLIPLRHGGCRGVCCDDNDCRLNEICDHNDNHTTCINGLARGTCIPTPANCTQCTADADCGGEICDVNTGCCIPDSSTCTVDADCEASLTCIENRCLQASGGNGDCGKGQWCCLQVGGPGKPMCFDCHPTIFGLCTTTQKTFCSKDVPLTPGFEGTTWIGNEQC